MIIFIGILPHLERRQKSLPFVNPYGLGGGGGGSLRCFQEQGILISISFSPWKNALHTYLPNF